MSINKSTSGKQRQFIQFSELMGGLSIPQNPTPEELVEKGVLDAGRFLIYGLEKSRLNSNQLGVLTRRGISHERNHDFLLVDNIDFQGRELQLLGVFDGCKSTEGSAQASKTGGMEVRKFLKKNPNNTDDLVELVTGSLLHANNRVVEEYQGFFRTTAAFVLVDWKKGEAVGGNSGDSRVYGMENGVCRQLTLDHGKHNFISSALGKEDSFQMFKFRVKFDPRQTFFTVSSDGMHDLIAGEKAYSDSDTEAQENKVGEILNKPGNAQQKSQILYSTAIQNKERDDVSIIVATRKEPKLSL